MSAHSVDAVVADRDVFTSMAASGYFTDLSTVLTSEDMAKWERILLRQPVMTIPNCRMQLATVPEKGLFWLMEWIFKEHGL